MSRCCPGSFNYLSKWLNLRTNSQKYINLNKKICWKIRKECTVSEARRLKVTVPCVNSSEARARISLRWTFSECPFLQVSPLPQNAVPSTMLSAVATLTSSNRKLQRPSQPLRRSWARNSEILPTLFSSAAVPAREVPCREWWTPSSTSDSALPPFREWSRRPAIHASFTMHTAVSSWCTPTS